MQGTLELLGIPYTGPGVMAWRMQHGADAALVVLNTADAPQLLHGLPTGLPAEMAALTEPLFPALMKPMLNDGFGGKSRDSLVWIPAALIGIFLMNVEYFNRPLNDFNGLPPSLTGANWFAGWAATTCRGCMPAVAPSMRPPRAV